MNSVMYDESRFKADIFELWSKAPDSLRNELMLPLWYEKQEGDILILGCNPGHVDKVNESDYSYSEYCRSTDKTRIESIILKYQLEHEKSHKYFKAITKILIDIPIRQYQWQDIFAYRHPSQNKFRSYVEEPKYIDFFGEQQEYSLRLLAYRKPRLILCANAYVRNRFEEARMILDVNNSDELEQYYQELNLAKYSDGAGLKIPIIFSRPFGGTGTMDTGTKGLFSWNLKRVLKHLGL